MSREQLKEKLLILFPDAEHTENKQYLMLTVDAGIIALVSKKLKTDKTLLFDYLFCLTGTDYPTYLTVTYHLQSTTLGHSLVLKAKTTTRENPVVPTVSQVWVTSEFHEREVAEMYGIAFENHPDPRKLLLPDDWKGFPMRKDYYDPEHIIELE